jgi:hypothetical protein
MRIDPQAVAALLPSADLDAARCNSGTDTGD